MTLDPDYQRPPGTPEPEGGTVRRSPYPGWLRNYGFNGWLNRANPRAFKAAILSHQIDKGKKPG